MGSDRRDPIFRTSVQIMCEESVWNSVYSNHDRSGLGARIRVLR